MVLKKSLDTMIYDLIIDDFYRGEYHGGQKVEPNVLAEKLEVSRTPVVQALKRLANEHILHVNNVGKYFIIQPTEKLVEEICALRFLFEEYAVRHHVRSRESGVSETLSEIARMCFECMQGNDPLSSVKKDMEFHRKLVELTGNSCLADSYRTVLNRYITVKYTLPRLYELQPAASVRHIEVAEAIRDGDEEEAVRLIRFHIFGAEEKMKQIIREEKEHGA